MYKICISAEKSYDAISWAAKNFNNNFNIELDHNWNYVFEFKDSQSASLFALKWK